MPTADPIEPYHLRQIKATKARDLNGIAALYAEDAVVMPPNDTTLFGRAEIRAWWEEYFQYFTIVSHTDTEREVKISGDWAFERIAFMVTILPKEGEAEIRDDARAVNVWKRQPDGNWKVSQTIWNSIKPVGAGTNRFVARRMIQKRARHRSAS